MLNTALRKLAALAETFDPRVQMRTRERLDEVRDHARELRRMLDAIDIRTRQLVALERLNWEQRSLVESLSTRLDPARARSHVCQVIERAAILEDPFPHVVIENWLPSDIYETLIDAIPPLVFFADRPAHKQQMNVPPSIAPEYSRRVWEFITDSVVGKVVGRAVEAKFERHISAYLKEICPASEGEWRAAIKMHVSDGRLMLRRPGYVIQPHRDPRWGFITCLAYLARPGDNEAYGTQLYRVGQELTAPDESAFYLPAGVTELAGDVPFRPDTMLVFLNNSSGAHGASIPADAEPPDLERYLYQFRIGPDPNGIHWLLSRMPDATRALWAGIKTDKHGY